MATVTVAARSAPALLVAQTGPLRVPALAESEIKLSLVLPTRNEARNIAELVRRLSEASIRCCRRPTS